MTDEELGRAWAAKHGRSPKVYSDGRAKWLAPYWCGVFEFNKSSDWLSPVVSAAIRDDQPDGDFPTESAAYSALGAALRRITEHVSV